ncbi:MAG: TetR/AcrR family transcriptional regulator [Methylocystaceae bacterium]|nr:MAG: TetR/AcrR family transcriptional regulator [Methylocystaceae bacterium]
MTASRRRRLTPTAVGADKSASSRLVAGGEEALARARLIEATIRLCCRNGIAATSVNDIIQESGVARMTLYNRFGSKDALILAALEHETSVWRAWFFSRLAEIDGNARERLLGIFDILAEWFRRDDYLGCALMNAAIESRSRDHKLNELIASHKRRILEQMRALAAAADVDDVEMTAQQFDLLMDGAIVKAAIQRSAAPAIEAREIATALLSP